MPCNRVLDENILGDLEPCGLRSPNFENPGLPGWVGGGRMEVCGGCRFQDGRSVAVSSWDRLLPSCLNKLCWNSHSWEDGWQWICCKWKQTPKFLRIFFLPIFFATKLKANAKSLAWDELWFLFSVISVCFLFLFCDFCFVVSDFCFLISVFWFPFLFFSVFWFLFSDFSFLFSDFCFLASDCGKK